MIRSLYPEHLDTMGHRSVWNRTVVEKSVTFGTNAIDSRITGGLAQRALHEVFAASAEDGSAAGAFAVMLGMRACPASRPIIWVRERRCNHHVGYINAAGLLELGFDPDHLILIDAPDTLAVLRAGADIVKCGQVGAVVIEPWGKAPLLDLTASRRLSMAAAASGVMALMVRVDAAPMPSAAQTRWRVATAPSSPLASIAPGYPAFDITLLRHRGGIAGFETRLEWNRDTRSFAPLSRSASAVPAVGAAQALPSNQKQAA
jgi:protein ImuA